MKKGFCIVMICLSLLTTTKAQQAVTAANQFISFSYMQAALRIFKRFYHTGSFL